MAFRYLIYSTGTAYADTIVRESATDNPGVNEASFYTDFIIPEIQPLYLWRVTGGNTVVPNTDANISVYLQAIAPPIQPEDDATVGYVTGITSQKIDIVTGATGQVPVFTANGNIEDSGTTTENTLRINSGLAKYNADYRGTFDNRTLVDREFVEKSVPFTVSATTSTGDITTTSTTDVLMTGMQFTNVPAGTYLLSQGTTLRHNQSNQTIYTNIYVGGTAVTNSELRWNRGGSQGDIATNHGYSNFLITLATTATVDIRWRTTAGTATSYDNRYLTLLKVNSLR